MGLVTGSVYGNRRAGEEAFDTELDVAFGEVFVGTVVARGARERQLVCALALAVYRAAGA